MVSKHVITRYCSYDRCKSEQSLVRTVQEQLHQDFQSELQALQLQILDLWCFSDFDSLSLRNYLVKMKMHIHITCIWRQVTQ